MKKLFAGLVVVLLVLTGAGQAEAATGHRVIVYYQTQYTGGTYVSPLTLTQNKSGVTDIVVGALHLDTKGGVTSNATPRRAGRSTKWGKALPPRRDKACTCSRSSAAPRRA